MDNFVVRDLLGLFSKKLDIKSKFTVNAMPKLEEVSSVKKGNTELDINWAINNYSSSQGDLSGIREYLAGDRLNSVHWKISARKEELYIKEYEKSGSEEYICIFDFNREYINKSFSLLYSVGKNILDSNKGLYVVWLSGGNEDLRIDYIESLLALESLIKNIYNSYPIHNENITLNQFRKKFGNSSAIYIGNNVELV